jgi:hypothetical protein
MCQKSEKKKKKKKKVKELHLASSSIFPIEKQVRGSLKDHLNSTVDFLSRKIK